MKRYISIFLIISLCLSFAACSANGNTPVTSAVREETTRPAPAFQTAAEEYSKDFTDENGRVVYTVRASLPQITADLPENIADDINRSLYGIFEDACETAESNIKNAAAFMDSQGHEFPWERSFDFEINLCSDRYFSITVRDYFTMFGADEPVPTLIGYTYDVVRGTKCTFSDFFYENHSYDSVKRVIVDEFIGRDIAEVFYDGAELDDEQRSLAYETADTENFYLTDDGIGFYFSKNAFDPEAYGTFVTHYTWEEIAVVLKRP